MDGFQYRWISSINDIGNNDTIPYIGYSIIDNVGYIYFHITWITLRIKINTDGKINFSVKYGDSGWIS